jgi:hypothetical protein
MADYGATAVTDAGVSLPAASYNAAAAGLTDRVPWGVLLHILNTNGATRTCTISTPSTVGGHAVTDPVHTIPATTGSYFLNTKYPWYLDPATGLVTLTWSANAGVTFAVLSQP